MLTSESIKKIEKNDHKQMFPRKFMGFRGVFFFGSLALMQFQQHHTLRLPAFNGRGSRGSR
jgi:hypothetical protein